MGRSAKDMAGLRQLLKELLEDKEKAKALVKRAQEAEPGIARASRGSKQCVEAQVFRQICRPRSFRPSCSSICERVVEDQPWEAEPPTKIAKTQGYKSFEDLLRKFGGFLPQLMPHKLCPSQWVVSGRRGQTFQNSLPLPFRTLTRAKMTVADAFNSCPP